MRLLSIVAALVAALPLLTVAAPTCDAPGYQKNTRPYLSQKSYALGTTKACGDRCWKEQKCASYAFSQGACFLYDVKLSQNFKSNTRSLYKFYEKACATPGPSTNGPRCKQVGYDDSIAGKKLTTTTCSTLESCATQCVRQARCKSYSYGRKTCTLYSVLVSNRFRSDARSPYTFSDRACKTTGVPATTPKGSSTRPAGSTTAKGSGTTGTMVTTKPPSTTGSSTITTPATTSTTDASGMTFSSVTPMFELAGGNSKRQVTGTPNVSNGFFSRTFNAKGERFITTDATNALKIKFTVPNGRPARGLDLISENSAAYVDLTALALVKKLASGSVNSQLFLGAALPGSPPADGSDSSLKRASPAGSFLAQTAIWTVDLSSFAMNAVWIDPATTRGTPLTLLTEGGSLFLTDDRGAFPNAQSLQVTANFPDPSAACVAQKLEWVAVKKQCDKPCSPFYPIRDPVNGVCGTGCPLGQVQKSGSVCACADEVASTMIDNVCRPKKTTTGGEVTTTPSATTTSLSGSTTSALSCPTGQVLKNGDVCACADEVASTMIDNLCRPKKTGTGGSSTSTTSQNQASSSSSSGAVSTTGTTTSSGAAPAQTFSNVIVSFNLPSPRKRQPNLDLAHGYISGTIYEDSGGSRYLTSDKNNALKVSFTIPAGSTTAQNVDLIGPSRALESGIPTIAIIADVQQLQGGSGHPFGVYSHYLYLGSSRATPAGALPQEGVDNTMSRAKSGTSAGMGFIAQTAVWDVDTTTGYISPYWVDQTGARNKLTLVTDGQGSLYLMPAGPAVTSNNTPLLIRAELPNTPTPAPPGGPADCRNGVVRCDACQDPDNYCRASSGECVPRDDVGACGFNCHPSNANGPASKDCWRCPNGYFGKGGQGCSPFPCPDPANQWRNRDGCQPNPVCTPPAVHNGFGSCVTYNSDGTGSGSSSKKGRGGTTTTTQETTTTAGPPAATTTS